MVNENKKIYLIQPGRVVQSRAGRDQGKYFVVLRCLEGGYAAIADGCTRKLAKPKIKKTKHLKPLEEVNQTLADKFLSGAKVFDSEVYSSLKMYHLKQMDGV